MSAHLQNILWWCILFGAILCKVELAAAFEFPFPFFVVSGGLLRTSARGTLRWNRALARQQHPTQGVVETHGTIACGGQGGGGSDRDQETTNNKLEAKARQVSAFICGAAHVVWKRDSQHETVTQGVALSGHLAWHFAFCIL